MAFPLSSLAWLWEALKKTFLRISSAKVGGRGTRKLQSQKRENFLSKYSVTRDPLPLLYFVYQKNIYMLILSPYICVQFVCKINELLGPPCHQHCLSKKDEILSEWVCSRSQRLKYPPWTNTYLIFVIFLHMQNFWRIEFTPKFTQ